MLVFHMPANVCKRSVTARTDAIADTFLYFGDLATSCRGFSPGDQGFVFLEIDLAFKLRDFVLELAMIGFLIADVPATAMAKRTAEETAFVVTLVPKRLR
jgi:hypothetical protein